MATLYSTNPRPSEGCTGVDLDNMAAEIVFSKKSPQIDYKTMKCLFEHSNTLQVIVIVSAKYNFGKYRSNFCSGRQIKSRPGCQAKRYSGTVRLETAVSMRSTRKCTKV